MDNTLQSSVASEYMRGREDASADLEDARERIRELTIELATSRQETSAAEARECSAGYRAECLAERVADLEDLLARVGIDADSLSARWAVANPAARPLLFT
jgi:coenzyme F420-reducing hydrogenase delta subunit